MTTLREERDEITYERDLRAAKIRYHVANGIHGTFFFAYLAAAIFGSIYFLDEKNPVPAVLMLVSLLFLASVIFADSHKWLMDKYYEPILDLKWGKTGS